MSSGIRMTGPGSDGKDFFCGKSVLITGASGFIGSHVVRRMVRENARVSVLTRKDSSLWRLKNYADDIIPYQADMRDYDRLATCVRRVKPDYVFHMAAYGVDSRQKDWFTAANTNVIGIVNLMRSLAKTGCEKLLNIGSCMEYGDKQELIGEGSTLTPFNIYGSTKAAATVIAHQLAGEIKLPIVTLRAFGIFGENEGSHKFFPHIILSLLRRQEVKLTGCEQFRDYCYIDNIIDVFVLAAINNQITDEIFNVGSGVIYPLRHYVDMVYSLMNVSGKPQYGAIPYRPGEVWRPHPDVSKIRTLLHWEPKVTLKDGLLRTIQWFDQNKGLYETRR